MGGPTMGGSTRNPAATYAHGRCSLNKL